MILRLNIASVLVFNFLFEFTEAVEIDNGLIGEPIVNCQSDSFTVQFSTKRPFAGNIYAKGFFDRPGCRVEGTTGDTELRIECMYMETQKTVTQQLEVSMLTTQDVGETTADMPQCTYEVLKEGPDGSPVAFARIGDSVYHKWSCVGDATKYCITVHTCVVDDGQGEKRVLLDEQGCAQDQYLLDNLQYPTALMAGQESHVFKFADKTSVHFSCQVRLHVKNEIGQCERSSDSCISPGNGGLPVQSLNYDDESSTLLPFPTPKDTFDPFAEGAAAASYASGRSARRKEAIQRGSRPPRRRKQKQKVTTKTSQKTKNRREMAPADQATRKFLFLSRDSPLDYDDYYIDDVVEQSEWWTADGGIDVDLRAPAITVLDVDNIDDGSTELQIRRSPSQSTSSPASTTPLIVSLVIMTFMCFISTAYIAHLHCRTPHINGNKVVF